MAKKLKFNLIVDGVRCKNIEDIQNNFNVLDLIEYFKSGKLLKWAKVRDLDELTKEIENIQSDDNLEIAKKLCRIFKIECDEEELNEELSVQTAEKIANGGEIDAGVISQLSKLNKLSELEARIKANEINLYSDNGLVIDWDNKVMMILCSNNIHHQSEYNFIKIDDILMNELNNEINNTNFNEKKFQNILQKINSEIYKQIEFNNWRILNEDEIDKYINYFYFLDINNCIIKTKNSEYSSIKIDTHFKKNYGNGRSNVNTNYEILFIRKITETPEEFLEKIKKYPMKSNWKII